MLRCRVRLELLGRLAEVGALPDRRQPTPPAWAGTGSPPGPPARCASACNWAVVVSDLAAASDTVFLYGVP